MLVYSYEDRQENLPFVTISYLLPDGTPHILHLIVFMDITSTNRYFFSEPKLPSLSQLLHFGISVYQADKWRELSSYIRWETKHRLGLFPRNNYITFSANKPFSIDALFVRDNLLSSRLRIRPVNELWRMVLSGTSKRAWATSFADDVALHVSYDGGQSFRECFRFNQPIQSLYVTEKQHLYACCSGILFRSIDYGYSFQNVLTLSSSNSYFLYNNGLTELPDETLVLGEYGVVRQRNSWQNVAYIYYSTDQGKTWTKSDFLVRDGVNKHVHLVKYSPNLKALLLTDGDNKKQVWMNRSLVKLGQAADCQGQGWARLNRSHYQMGGYLSMAELSETTFLGSDYLGGTNFMVSTKDGLNFSRQIIPDPYRRSPIMNMVTRKTKNGQDELWAVLHNSISSFTRSLVMVSTDSGKTWRRVIDYDGTQHEIKLVSSSTHPVEQLYLAVITKQEDKFTQAVFCLSDD